MCNLIIELLEYTHYFNLISAYWIAQKGLKIVFDEEDNLEKSPYDIACVRDIMMKHFDVSGLTHQLSGLLLSC